MKVHVFKLLLAALIVFLGACANTNITRLSYSAVFKLKLPSKYVGGATVFYSDELSIKTSQGILISGKIVSAISEGLPDDFDMRKYPRYLLGLEKLGEELVEYKDLFLNSKYEIDQGYGVENIETNSFEQVLVYSLCRETACLAYVVQKEFSEHIFTIHSIGMYSKEFQLLLKENLNVEY